MPKKKTNVTYLGTGRRKSSVARVYMTPGTGKIMVGEKTLEEYLPQEILRMVVKSPLVETGTDGQYDIFINVYGGGMTGQAGAMRHGIWSLTGSRRRLQTCIKESRLLNT